MKKFLPVIVAAASIASASAAGTIIPGLASRPMFSQKERTATLKERVAKKSARKAIKKQAPQRLEAEDFDNLDLITSAPDGVLNHYSGSTYSYTSSYTEETEGTINGVIADITFTEDGKAYWLNPLTNAPFDSYIVGDVQGDQITFTFPQYIGMEDYYGWFTLNYYVALFEPYYDEDYGNDFDATDDQVLTLTINADGTITQNGDAYIGLGDYDEDYEYFFFDGYADTNITLTPFNDTVATAPNNATFENWVIEEQYNDLPTWLMQVAVDGDDFYFKGFSQDYPEMIFKGHLENDGNATYVTIPNSQYVGATTYRYNYLLTGTISYEYDEDYGQEVGMVTLTDGDYKFNYDAQNNRLTAPAEDDILFINEGTEDISAVAIAVNPTIYKQGEILDYTPETPYDLNLVDYWDYYEQMCFNFSAVCQTVQEDLLSSNDCSYEIFINGDLFTFTTDEYTEIDQEYTEVPFNYTDDYDIVYTTGTETHSIFLNDDSMDNIGVRLIYTNPTTGEKFYSEIATLVINESGIESVSAENSKVISAEYFDLTGKRVDASATGVTIVRLTHADGSTTTAKRLTR